MGQQQQQDLRTIFDSFDLDKSNSIQIKELQKIAQKLGQPIKQDQLNEIMETLDINGDKKISFEEFQYWWKKGKKGKMMKLIELKAKALKLTNFIKKKFNDANIGLEANNKTKPDIFDFKVSFGKQLQQCVHISYDFFIQGNDQKQLFKQIQSINSSVNQDTLGVLIKIPSKQPSHAKFDVDQIINDIINIQGFPIPIQNLHDNPFFSYSCQVQNECIIISLFAKNQINAASQPILDGADATISGMGNQFYGKTNVDIRINSSVDQILQRPIHENLLSGFSFQVKAQANNSSFQKIRKLMQKQNHELPPIINLVTLIRGTKLHWNLKSPKSIEKFLQKLGISETVNDLPLLYDLLEGLSQNFRKESEQNPFVLILRKLGRMALKHTENNLEMYNLMGKVGTGCLKIDAKNATKVYSVIFDEF